MADLRRVLLASFVMAGLSCALAGQQQAAPDAGQPVYQVPQPPATKLEGFVPTPGALYSVGHENLGTAGSVTVEMQEMRDPTTKPVRGLVVRIGQTQSFVDADEVQALARGCDALLQVTSNPTSFKAFESRYSTKGNLELQVEISYERGVFYTVTVGRFQPVTSQSLSQAQMAQLRDMFATAAERFAALSD